MCLVMHRLVGLDVYVFLFDVMFDEDFVDSDDVICFF